MATETRKYTLFHDPEAKSRGGGGGGIKITITRVTQVTKKIEQIHKNIGQLY